MRRSGRGRWATITVEGVGSYVVPPGRNLRETLRSEGFYLDGTCSDKGTCGRCVVRIVAGDAGEPSAGERGLLGGESLSVKNRLACLIEVTGDLTVAVEKERVLEIDRTGRWKGLGGSPLWAPDAYLPTREGYGVAVDLGTTSVASALHEMSTGRLLDIRSEANPQLPWGEEVLSRLEAASGDPETANSLREMVWKTVRDQIGSMCRRTGVSTGRVGRVTVVGNSAVHHLVLGLPTESLLFPPYLPADRESRLLPAADPPMMMDLADGAAVYFPPLVGGFAGSDLLASLVAVGTRGNRTGALMDVGTNTEIAVWRGERIFAATAPSGPAFEGGHISAGMRAEEGAIWKVRISGPFVRYEVIGGVKPRGICGTGIIDAVSAMLSSGLLDDSGLMRTGSHPGLDGRGLVIDGSVPIVMEPGDVATVQKAKAAVSAVFHTVLQTAGLAVDGLERFFLAGSFGSRLNPANAIRVGLLPSLDPERYVLAGNAAHVGASMILLSERAVKKAEDLARTITYISAAQDEGFEELFVNSLNFSPGDG